MHDSEVQRRFQAGELVFTDGHHVFIRGRHMGYKDKPWEIIDPNLTAFAGDAHGMAAWATSKHSWTPAHTIALVKVLQPFGITFPSWFTAQGEVAR